MNNYNELHTPLEADFQFLLPSAIKSLPHSIEYGSRWDTYGSSSGWSYDTTQPAFGEYLERKHFYLDVPTHAREPLDETLTAEELAEFQYAFAQTGREAASPWKNNLPLELTRVIRIKDYSACKIPTACIKLSACTSAHDNEIYPLRDTCGCSAHTSIDKAIFGAIKEALERQYLLRFWLTGSYCEPVETLLLLGALKNSPTSTLFKRLMQSGEITALNLTDRNFPGTCILLCYGNPMAHTAVRYCAGMAYAENLENALEKSVIELWQTFRFMHSFSAAGKDLTQIKDPYLQHFLNANSYQTYLTITTITPHTVTDRNSQEFTLENLIQLLRERELYGYLYLNQLLTDNTTIYFCKYLSPNIFLHMNNSKNFNTSNLYSRHFLSEIRPDRLATMVPFP